MKTTHRIEYTDAYLAEAQRLVISQNKLLTLIYLNPWFVWLPVPFIAFGLVYLNMQHALSLELELFDGGLIALVVVNQFFKSKRLAKARDRNSLKGLVVSYVLTDQGTHNETPMSRSDLDWTAFAAVRAYPRGVLLKLKAPGYVWLPDESLTEGTPTEVRELVAAHIKDMTVAK